jgi:hypothetical protein
MQRYDRIHSLLHIQINQFEDVNQKGEGSLWFRGRSMNRLMLLKIVNRPIFIIHKRYLCGTFTRLNISIYV